MSRLLSGPNARPSEENTENVVLYQAGMSPCARRVRITLYEKHIPFDVVEVDVGNMQQRSPEYLSLNPNGFVPTLSHRGHVIFESGAINEYLEDQFPEVSLIPPDAYERAQVRMWMAAEGTMAKIYRSLMYQRLAGGLLHLSRTLDEAIAIAAKATDDPQDLSWEGRVWSLEVLTSNEEAEHETLLLEWLDNVEAALQNSDFLVGERFSQADITMYPRIAMYEYLGIGLDEERYPAVLRWMSRLAQRPSFEASMTPDAKQQRRLATSPFLRGVLDAVAKPPNEMSLFDKLKLWGVGKVMRRVMRVDDLLKDNAQLRPLYVPEAPDGELPAMPLSVTPAERAEMDVSATLFGDERNPSTWRLKALLAVLGRSCGFEAAQVGDTAALPDQLLDIAPHREFPLLVNGSRVISGADTIAEYLVATAGGEALWTPSDSLERARSNMWLALESGSHKELTPLWQRYVCGDESAAFVADEAKALNRLTFTLGILDVALSERPYLCAERFGYADLAWKSRLDALIQVPAFQMREFPALADWYDRLSELLPSIVEC